MTKVFEKHQLNRIARLLKKHEAVAFPTDTVFGLGVIYNDEVAFNNMKQAKGRPDSKPFPVMVSSIEQLDTVAFTDERIRRIATLFMPGALTLILKKKNIDDRFTAGMDTVAVRIPDDEFVIKLLEKVGPMFVTSANLSDMGSCKDDREVLQQLDGRIAAIVKGSANSYVSSTIIDCTGEQLKCLREGQLTLEEIERSL